MNLHVSRSSDLYRFMFGERPRGMHGFPEPRLDTMSLGVFVCLLVVMAILRPFSVLMLLVMDAMLRVVAFLVDGSRVHGSIGANCTISPIEPWPRVAGMRASPWILLALIVTAYQYIQGGIGDAIASGLFFGSVTLVARSMDKHAASPSETLAEAFEPAADRMLVRAYVRKSWFLPVLRFVP